MSHATDHHPANHHPRHYGGAIYVNKENYIDVEDALYKCFYKSEIAAEVISYSIIPTLNHHVYPTLTTTPDCQVGSPTSSGNPQAGHQSPSPTALGAVFEGGGGGGEGVAALFDCSHCLSPNIYQVTYQGKKAGTTLGVDSDQRAVIEHAKVGAKG